jgi:hypothetical protein
MLRPVAFWAVRAVRRIAVYFILYVTVGASSSVEQLGECEPQQEQRRWNADMWTRKPPLYPHLLHCRPFAS